MASKSKAKRKDVAAVEQVISRCDYCGAFHKGSCPRVRSVEYNLDGSIKQVNLFNPTRSHTDEKR